MISGFKGRYRFLSNFFPARVTWHSMTFPTTEHAYQAAKATNDTDRLMIARCLNPGSAKRLGRIIELRSDWEEIKVSVMLHLLRQKFCQPDLQRKLLATNLEELVEANNWHDVFYGECDGECRQGPHEPFGENQLGKLLMQVRLELSK